MINLILAILSSACVSIFMRLGEKKISNNMVMFAVNYLLCIILARIFMGQVNLFTMEEGIGSAVILGIISGILYLAGFVLLQQNIKKNGMVLAAIFMKLGVIIPTLMAMIVFRERPRILQIFGIIIAIMAIIVFNFEKDDINKKLSKLLLIILLLCGGITDSMSNIFDKIGNPYFKDHYLFYTFFVALLCALILCIINRKRISKWDAIMGIVIGLPNYFSARFLLQSLASVPAIIVYPVYSVATIVVVSLVSVFLFKERLGKQKVIAILMVFVALVLINI